MSEVNILLIEDENLEAMYIKKTLESFGWKVIYIASEGEEAIRKVKELNPDLVLVDIILRGEMDGIQTAAKIKKLNIPVIYLTAHSEDSTVQQAKLTEPYGYVIKPFEPRDLKNSIELALFKHEMEQRLRQIIQGSPIPQFVIDKDHRVIYWNKALEEFSSINESFIIGTQDHWKAYYTQKKPCLSDLVLDFKGKQVEEYSDRY